jgi:omega-amidase
MSELRVMLIQPDTFWENAEANRAELEELIRNQEKTSDLIVLPETFTTGFSSEGIKLAEPMNFTTHRWMKMMAAETQAAVCGSLFISDGGKTYNRFLFVKPTGETHYYNKRHLFGLGNEGMQFTAGAENIIIEWKGWKIKPQICYDLRFPVWARNVENAYDLLLYVANWPATRIQVWNTLLAARAIENQAFVIGCNRTGVDGNKIHYTGESQIIDFKGNVIEKLSNDMILGSAVLSKSELADFRKTFPVWADADRFDLN